MFVKGVLRKESHQIFFSEVSRTDDLEFSVKFDEDKEDGDDELTVEEDEDEDELEVEEEEEEDEVLISHLSIAKSQIRPKVSIPPS